MTDKPALYDELWQQLYSGSEIGRVLEVLTRLADLHERGELSVKERYDLQWRAFLILKELTAETADEAQKLILENLLPQCLTTHPEASYELYQHRECLVEWLSQYPEEVHHNLRDKVLDKAHASLKASDARPACWTISQIGYRTDEIVDALWETIDRDGDDVGDTAIAVIASLGVPTDQRKPILEELHRRAARGYKQPIASGMIQLADPASAEVVYRCWIVDSGRELSPMERSVALSVLFHILDANNEDDNLQSQVWQWLTTLAEQKPEFFQELHLGPIGPACNSDLVIPTMLRWIGQSLEEAGNLSWQRYRIGLRLEECVRPRQLEGWKRFLSDRTIEALRQDACQDTGSESALTTQGTSVKRKSWNTALRAGYEQSLDWFEAAAIPETNRFVQQWIMKKLSCFRFEPLPEFVTGLITKDYDRATAGGDGQEFARRLAAIQMARSTASSEAFDALLNFGLQSEGKAFMDSVYALTEVALYLLDRRETVVIDGLVHAIIHREEHQRSAAAYAIGYIASVSPDLFQDQIEQIVRAFLDEEREPYERSSLIATLKYLKDWKIPDDLAAQLKDWAHRPDQWIGGSSLEVLGYRGFLCDDRDLLRGVLGLQQVDGGWDLDPGADRFEWAPHIIGLLYFKQPETFSPALASLVNALDWLSVPQVYDWLLLSHGASDQPALPDAISDALVQRVYETQTSVHSETQVFQVLQELAPEKLAQEGWRDYWDDWLSDGRVALAEALGKAQLELAARDKAVSKLQRLVRDGKYEVRRSAYRALARQSMDDLLRICLSWLRAPSTELRLRAAEGCGWLDCAIDDKGSDAFEELHRVLIADSEKLVREAAQRAWKERRDRSWAEEYLTVVQGVKGKTNKEILEAWCYGDALARIGDDACIEALREHLSENSHPPNVRYWIKRITEEMKKNWRKTTQKWPEPWFAWEGTIIEGQGKLLFSGNVVEVKYSIWSQPRSAPSEPPRYTWGGIAWLPDTLPPELDYAVIELEDGRREDIFIGSTSFKSDSGSKVTFTGRSDYPE